jgi:hypothetical protein
MKASKRLKMALAEIEKHAKDKPKVKFSQWINTQPWSTRRGIHRGNFVMPDYVEKWR